MTSEEHKTERWARGQGASLRTETCWKQGDEKLEPGDVHGGVVDRNPSVNAGDRGSIPDLGRLHMSWSN